MKPAPKKLSKKGTVNIKCSICKRDGHNARGHYKYINTVVPEARQPFETQDLVSDYVSSGYSDQFNYDMWYNSQLNVDFTNQSIITQVVILILIFYTSLDVYQIADFIC